MKVYYCLCRLIIISCNEAYSIILCFTIDKGNYDKPGVFKHVLMSEIESWTIPDSGTSMKDVRS